MTASFFELLSIGNILKSKGFFPSNTQYSDKVYKIVTLSTHLCAIIVLEYKNNL